MSHGYCISFCLYPRSDTGERLDKTLAGLFPAHPRTAVQRLIADGAVHIDGECCRRPAHRPAGGCGVVVDFSHAPPPPATECDAENLPIEVVHEDEDILIINKAPGMTMHPGRGQRNGTLQSALMHYHPPSASMPRAGIVHRLDKDTSGLLVAAKTESARQKLIEQFQERTIGREYLAIVHGAPPMTGLINRPLAPDKNMRGRMAVRHNGKEAVTRFAVERQWDGFALLRCWLETGRTHQIRAHLEYAGHPVAGDPAYQRRAKPLPFDMQRQALHAEKLRLLHPASGKECKWQAAPPADMQLALRTLGEGNTTTSKSKQ